MNAFNLELVRLWKPVTLEFTHQSCVPSSDVYILQKMQTWLNYASDFIPDADFHQGELKCLEGEVKFAEEIWSEDADHPISAFFAAILSVSHGKVIKTPFALEIGKYGFLTGYQANLDENYSKAIPWYFLSIVYDPNIIAASHLEQIYRLQGDLEGANNLWTDLSQTISPDIPLYWWAKGKESAREGNKSTAGDYFYQGGTLAAIQDEPIEAYRSFTMAGQMWFNSEEYDRAEDAFYKALEIKLDYLYVDLPEQLPYPYLWLGRAALAQSKYKEALEFLDQALTIDPTSSQALYENALVLDSLGRQTEAIDTLTEAIANNPDPPEQWRSMLEEWKK